MRFGDAADEAADAEDRLLARRGLDGRERLLAVTFGYRDGRLSLALPPQRPAQGRLPRPASSAHNGAVTTGRRLRDGAFWKMALIWRWASKSWVYL